MKENYNMKRFETNMNVAADTKDMTPSSMHKGFSLVELVIVIAIMAVLIGLLAPQFIRYIEKAKEAVDITTMDNAYELGNAEMAGNKMEINTTYYYDGTALTTTKPSANYGRGSSTNGDKTYDNPCCDSGKYDPKKSYSGMILTVTATAESEDSNYTLHVHWTK